MSRTTDRRGGFLLEILLATLLLAVLLVPILGLSARNHGGHRELLERNLIHGMALDMLERLERYKPQWPLPEEHERFGPADRDQGDGRLFPGCFREHLEVLETPPRLEVHRERVPGASGLFRLTVTVEWRGRRGQARKASFSRYCYAP